MYLDKKKLPEFQIFGIDPKVLLTFLDKVSQILVLYNLGKNICFVYLYYLPLFENISRNTGIFFSLVYKYICMQ